MITPLAEAALVRLSLTFGREKLQALFVFFYGRLLV